MNRVIQWLLPFMVVTMTGCTEAKKQFTNSPNVSSREEAGHQLVVYALREKLCKRIDERTPDTTCKWAVPEAIEMNVTGYQRLKRWGPLIQAHGTQAQKDLWNETRKDPTDFRSIAMVAAMLDSAGPTAAEVEFQKLMDPSVRE